MDEKMTVEKLTEKKRAERKKAQIFNITSSIIAIAAIVFIVIYFVSNRFPGLGTMLLAAVIAMLAVRNTKNPESGTLVTVVLALGSLLNVAASVLQWVAL